MASAAATTVPPLRQKDMLIGLSERWLPVVGWEDCYQVSDQGRIRCLARFVTWSTCAGCGLQKGRWTKEIVTRGYLNNRGYYMYRLSRFGKTTAPKAIHQLVCESFHGPKPAGCEVLHGNGIKTDCRAANLRWGTKSENAQDRFRHGTAIFGRDVNTAVLDEEAVKRVRNRGPYSPALAKELGQEFSCSAANIKRILLRETWKHI